MPIFLFFSLFFAIKNYDLGCHDGNRNNGQGGNKNNRLVTITNDETVILKLRFQNDR